MDRHRLLLVPCHLQAPRARRLRSPRQLPAAPLAPVLQALPAQLLPRCRRQHPARVQARCHRQVPLPFQAAHRAGARRPCPAAHHQGVHPVRLVRLPLYCRPHRRRRDRVPLRVSCLLPRLRLLQVPSRAEAHRRHPVWSPAPYLRAHLLQARREFPAPLPVKLLPECRLAPRAPRPQHPPVTHHPAFRLRLPALDQRAPLAPHPVMPPRKRPAVARRQALHWCLRFHQQQRHRPHHRPLRAACLPVFPARVPQVPPRCRHRERQHSFPQLRPASTPAQARARHPHTTAFQM